MNNRPITEIAFKNIVYMIKNAIKYLLSKRLFVLVCSVFGLVLGIVFSMVKKPTYIAELTFALEDSKSSNLGTYASIASQYGVDLGLNAVGGAFSGDNLLELIKSRYMVQKALLTEVSIHGRQKTLAEVYIDFNNLREMWKGNPSLEKLHFEKNTNQQINSLQQDSILGEFYSKLIVNNLSVEKLDKKLSIISVQIKSNNELFCKYFSETLVNVVCQFYVETKTKKAAQNLFVLEHQADSVKYKLNTAINGVAYSGDINPNANPNKLILHTPAQHRQIDVQLNTAILVELVKNIEIAKVSLRNETPFIQIIDKPILPLMNDKISKMKSGILGFMAGLILSIFIVISLYIYDKLM